jgi:hypothetical protein
MIDRHIFASFPNIPVSVGQKFIHSPEKWGSGACLVIGVPRFEIESVAGVVAYQKDRLVQLRVKNEEISLISQSLNNIVLKGRDNLCISCKVVPLDKQALMGFSLVLTLQSCSDSEIFTAFHKYAYEYRQMLETLLMQLTIDECTSNNNNNVILDHWRHRLVQDELDHKK